MLPAKEPTLEGPPPPGDPAGRRLPSRGRCPLLHGDLGSQNAWPCSELSQEHAVFQRKEVTLPLPPRTKWEPVIKGTGESVCVCEKESGGDLRKYIWPLSPFPGKASEIPGIS